MWCHKLVKKKKKCTSINDQGQRSERHIPQNSILNLMDKNVYSMNSMKVVFVTLLLNH